MENGRLLLTGPASCAAYRAPARMGEWSSSTASTLCEHLLDSLHGRISWGRRRGGWIGLRQRIRFVVGRKIVLVSPNTHCEPADERSNNSTCEPTDHGLPTAVIVGTLRHWVPKIPTKSSANEHDDRARYHPRKILPSQNERGRARAEGSSDGQNRIRQDVRSGVVARGSPIHKQVKIRARERGNCSQQGNFCNHQAPRAVLHGSRLGRIRGR